MEKEIRHIVEYQNSVLPSGQRKGAQELDSLIRKIIKDYQNNNYDFSRLNSMILRQEGKKRVVKSYNILSCEETLCIYIKRILDRKLRMKYPNRNKYMCSLFDIMNAVKNMSDFTIVRFDFKNYFNTLSSEYVYHKCISGVQLERDQQDLIEKFTQCTGYAYAGLNTSNLFCEVIANEFDKILQLKFLEDGIIFYKRYIDDGLLILNAYTEECICFQKIQEAIQEVFYNKSVECRLRCRTVLNETKKQYISRRNMPSKEKFGFLGYLFEINLASNGKITLKYGMSPQKIRKYTKRLNRLVEEFKGDDELLRHQIIAFTSRIVYTITVNHKTMWKSKGLISNYRELRYRIDLLTQETEEFLKNAVFNAFRENDLDPPNYLMFGDRTGYSLYENLKRYKTLLFVERIGINCDTIMQLCNKVGIDTERKRAYDDYVRDYLIKVKVGH